jgi:SAM-dependent methyltransferase
VDPTTFQARARSFGPAAERYDRIRPHYPEAAIRWILGDAPLTVVDLGAGTGILTRQLVAIGHRVIPVEPDPGMRERLVAAGGGAPQPLAGSAEEIPLPDAQADAVVAGQAYHWFDPARAHPEIARVLKPGGVFGPLWNDRDEDVSWVVALSAVVHEREGASPGLPVNAGDPFGPVEQALFRQSVTHTPDTLVELMRSRSYHLIATPERQAEMDAAIRNLCATHPELAGRAEFELPYVTRTYRTHRLP